MYLFIQSVSWINLAQNVAMATRQDPTNLITLSSVGQNSGKQKNSLTAAERELQKPELRFGRGGGGGEEYVL